MDIRYSLVALYMFRIFADKDRTYILSKNYSEHILKAGEGQANFTEPLLCVDTNCALDKHYPINSPNLCTG